MASVTPATGSSVLADAGARRSAFRHFRDRWSSSSRGQKLPRSPGRHLRFADRVGELGIWTLDDEEVRSVFEAGWR
jgi:hypothetical protein